MGQRGSRYHSSECYLMKGYVKDFTNSFVSYRDSVAFPTFCVLVYLKIIGQHGNEANNKTFISNAFFVYHSE